MGTTYGWVTDTEANAYFLLRYGASAAWAAVASGDHAALLTTAYNKIVDSNKFDLPADADATAEMKRAQYEQAYFVLMWQDAVDRRKGLQVQGVTAAGVVKEAYDWNALKDVPLAAIVEAILKKYAKTGLIYFQEIARTPDQGIDYDGT